VISGTVSGVIPGSAGGGGAGGGGYYGGGAGGDGAALAVVAAGGGGGGGGSNYTGAATNVTVTDGSQPGNGQVTISFPAFADLSVSQSASPNPVHGGRQLSTSANDPNLANNTASITTNVK
jgi:hypothetical protein